MRSWEGHGEGRQHLDVFGVGKARGITGLGLLVDEFDVLVVVGIDGGGQHTQVAAFQVHVVAALELRELQGTDAAQVDFHQGVDGDAEILGEGDQGLEVGLGDTVFIAAQCGALHLQGKGNVILSTTAMFAKEFDIGVEVHIIGVLMV